MQRRFLRKSLTKRSRPKKRKRNTSLIFIKRYFTKQFILTIKQVREAPKNIIQRFNIQMTFSLIVLIGHNLD